MNLNITHTYTKKTKFIIQGYIRVLLFQAKERKILVLDRDTWRGCKTDLFAVLTGLKSGFFSPEYFMCISLLGHRL